MKSLNHHEPTLYISFYYVKPERSIRPQTLKKRHGFKLRIDFNATQSPSACGEISKGKKNRVFKMRHYFIPSLKRVQIHDFVFFFVSKILFFTFLPFSQIEILFQHFQTAKIVYLWVFFEKID